jgi:PST family polysaccharide transporter
VTAIAESPQDLPRSQSGAPDHSHSGDGEAFASLERTCAVIDDANNIGPAVLDVPQAFTASPTAPAPIKAISLAESVMLLIMLTIVQRLVGFLRGILFCRWLDAEELGQWDLTFSFLLLAAPAVLFGLPGSFGRYLEHFRQRGQLRTFLGRTIAATLVLATLAMILVAFGRPWLSNLIFGRADEYGLMTLIIFGLGALIAHNFLISLFTALRMYRVVSGMQFFQSVSFALIGVALVLGWHRSADSVVLAFGISCLVTAFGAVFWLRKTWRNLPPATEPLPQRDLWAKLLPFALWLWVSNWLANLFDIVDRYMIVHYGGLGAAEALDQVGQYHSSRIVPVLFVGIAELLAALLTPHLSHDWEEGRRDAVASRLNLVLKLFGLSLTAVSAVVLIGSPLLFGVALEGKYAIGQAVLPWTLAYCIWWGMSGITQNYVWCTEKARLATLPLIAGMLLNIVLNWQLLPSYGLFGAVLGCTASRLGALALLCVLAYWQGLRFHRGTLWIFCLPALLCIGPWYTLAALAALVVESVIGERFFDPTEKTQLLATARNGWDRIQSLCLRNKAKVEIG